MTDPSPSPVTNDGLVERKLKQAWVDFLDANPDDLNSPEELPDHALMTCKQFVQYALAASDRDVLVRALKQAREALGVAKKCLDPNYVANFDLEYAFGIIDAALIPLAD